MLLDAGANIYDNNDQTFQEALINGEDGMIKVLKQWITDHPKN